MNSVELEPYDFPFRVRIGILESGEQALSVFEKILVKINPSFYLVTEVKEDDRG